MHFERVPRKISRALTGVISLQKGQMAMTASHSSEHLHRLATLTAHPQHMGCVQHRKCVMHSEHESSGQNVCAQMKHASSSSSSCADRLDRLSGIDTSITAA